MRVKFLGDDVAPGTRVKVVRDPDWDGPWPSEPTGTIDPEWDIPFSVIDLAKRTDIDVPVTLWVGALDPGRAPRDAPEIARRIPSCTVHRCEDEGHFVLIPRWPEIVEQASAGQG